MEKEDDKCILGHTEFEFWMAFQLGCSACKTGALEKYQIYIGNIYLEFKCIEIIAEPGE